MDELRDQLELLKQQGLYLEGRRSNPPSPRLAERFDLPTTVKEVRLDAVCLLSMRRSSSQLS
jgi:hypothetical protein